MFIVSKYTIEEAYEKLPYELLKIICNYHHCKKCYIINNYKSDNFCWICFSSYEICKKNNCDNCKEIFKKHSINCDKCWNYSYNVFNNFYFKNYDLQIKHCLCKIRDKDIYKCYTCESCKIKFLL